MGVGIGARRWISLLENIVTGQEDKFEAYDVEELERIREPFNTRLNESENFCDFSATYFLIF